jgi:hypothetical protein
MKKTTATTVAEYNALQSSPAREVCDFLATRIPAGLPKSASKLWHGSPVWFIAGNPVVSYSVRKNGTVSLMFFSGQSFDESELKPEGSFKASEIQYANLKDIKRTHLQRWLKKAKTIQWDYKNIVKRKGVLEILPSA